MELCLGLRIAIVDMKFNYPRKTHCPLEQASVCMNYGFTTVGVRTDESVMQRRVMHPRVVRLLHCQPYRRYESAASGGFSEAGSMD